MRGGFSDKMCTAPVEPNNCNNNYYQINSNRSSNNVTDGTNAKNMNSTVHFVNATHSEWSPMNVLQQNVTDTIRIRITELIRPVTEEEMRKVFYRVNVPIRQLRFEPNTSSAEAIVIAQFTNVQVAERAMEVLNNRFIYNNAHKMEMSYTEWGRGVMSDISLEQQSILNNNNNNIMRDVNAVLPAPTQPPAMLPPSPSLTSFTNNPVITQPMSSVFLSGNTPTNANNNMLTYTSSSNTNMSNILNMNDVRNISNNNYSNNNNNVTPALHHTVLQAPEISKPNTFSQFSQIQFPPANYQQELHQQQSHHISNNNINLSLATPNVFNSTELLPTPPPRSSQIDMLNTNPLIGLHNYYSNDNINNNYNNNNNNNSNSNNNTTSLLGQPKNCDKVLTTSIMPSPVEFNCVANANNSYGDVIGSNDNKYNDNNSNSVFSINQTLVTNSNNNMSANVVTSTNSRGRGRGRGQRKETNFDSSSSNNNTINTGVMFSQPVHAGSRARGRGRGRREMIDSNQTGANTSVPSNVALSAYKNAPSHNSFSSAGFNPIIPMTQSSMIPIPFINPLIPEYNFGAMPNVMLPLTSSTDSSNISTVFLSMTMMPVTEPLQSLFVLTEAYGGVVFIRRNNEKPHIVTVKMRSVEDAQNVLKYFNHIPFANGTISAKPFPTYRDRHSCTDDGDPFRCETTQFDFTASRHRSPMQRSYSSPTSVVKITNCNSYVEADVMTYLNSKSFYPERIRKEDDGSFTVQLDSSETAVKLLIACQSNICNEERSNVIFVEVPKDLKENWDVA